MIWGDNPKLMKDKKGGIIMGSTVMENEKMKTNRSYQFKDGEDQLIGELIMENTVMENESGTVTQTAELVFDDQDFKREVMRAIACTDDRPDWHGVILFDPQEDGSIAIVGTDGFILYRGFLKPIQGKFTEHRIYHASVLAKIIKLIKKTDRSRVSFDPSSGMFRYGDQSFQLVHHAIPYPRYDEALRLKEKLMTDGQLTSGLFFNPAHMGKIMKVIEKESGNFKFSIFSQKDPAYIEFEDNPGVFITMPYEE